MTNGLSRTLRWGCWLWVVFLAGCRPQAVPGGTDGVVHHGSVMLSDIHVRLYAADTLAPVGVGISESDGRFALRTPDASAPLWLPPGSYKAAIESIGPTSLVFPKEYGDPQTSPLTITWNGTDRQLDLEVPAPTLAP